MIDDLAGYCADAELEADLCIVGAGAAGIALARRFIGSGLRVLLVESGGLDPDPQTDLLKRGETDGLGAEGLTEGRGRVFGGTTTLWAGQCIPMDPIDFERREWVPHSGWPISAGEVGRHYPPAAELFAVGGETHDEGLWQRWGGPPPALAPDRLVHSFTVWSPRPDLGKAFRAEISKSRDVRVLLHANVTEIDTGDSGRHLRSITVRSVGGRAAVIRPRACVLCCGGIENARLLLVAAEAQVNGLGTGHQNIGRYFQDHPNAHCATLRTAAPRGLQDPYSLFYRRRRRYLPKLKLAPAVQRAEQVLNCAANLDYEFGDEGINELRRLYREGHRQRRFAASPRELRAIARSIPAVADTAYRRFARGRSTRSAPATIRLQVHAEQAPDPESRVTLSPQRDALGVPLARVQWRLGDLERRSFEVMTATIAHELRRLGLAEADPDAWLTAQGEAWKDSVGNSYHHSGATRMSERPADGVVDPDCQVHGVTGLFVSGGSVFPTSGFANPTLTIAALALRLADHLLAGLQR